MSAKILFLFIGLCAFALNTTSASRKHRLVVYWGQNAVYNLKKEKQYWEKDLVHFCKNTGYDTIILAFMHVFFDARQKDSMPALNFAFHCENQMSSDYPFLLRCPKIEAGIKECQSKGKQVLISLGGATGGYGFQTDNKAKLFAHTVWDLLLGGRSKIRPFGNADLDGVDLDIEGGSHIGYTAFVRELRQITSTAQKKYIIAAAPQCPFPDAFLGPEIGKAFEDVPDMFDEIYVQFYNNYCQTGDPKQFYPTLRKWLDYSTTNNGALIFIGVPSHEAAAFGRGFWRTPQEIAAIYQKVKNEPRFGGFMFWDASFDQNNVISGQRYSDHVIEIMGGSGPRPTIPAPQTTATPTTKQVVVTTKQPVVTTTPKIKPTVTKPGKLSCSGLRAGMYPHPTDCNKYFHCLSGNLHVKECPSGLRYNPTHNYCDWPRNVKC